MGCCVIAALLLLMPRLAIVLLWLFTNFLGRAYDGGWVLPVLGFFLLPWTTLAYAYSVNAGYGLSPTGILIIVLGVILDAFTHGGGGRSYYRRRAA
ncbi:MAG TPA: hypothetical protein VGK50_01550 [Coriobacteriia bacterium]|jgi:hypothetical protein